MPYFRGGFLQIEEEFSPLAKKASKKMPTKSCGKSTNKTALAKMNTVSYFAALYHNYMVLQGFYSIIFYFRFHTVINNKALRGVFVEIQAPRGG